jgi:hypothetical protein
MCRPKEARVSNNKSESNPQPISLVVGSPVSGSPALSTPGKVIALAERAHEIISITELEPNNGVFIGKHINRDGRITQYPTVTWWRQRVARVPASIPHVFAYLREARERNVCLIRGAPANVERQPTRRQKAGVVGGRDRRDHGFVDEPTKLLYLDVDGIKINWRANPERAIRTIVGQLGEPWASTSFVWFFSATHGLKLDERKRWTGKISDGRLRVRLVFITERPLNVDEAGALTNIVRVRLPELDPAISRQVQPNYIKRPHWVEHPDRDVLGEIPTIGWVRGAFDYLIVSDDLTHKARWARAQGHNVDIAEHPNAEAAVRGIGSDGSVRSHLMAAVRHLLLANPAPEVVSFADHSMDVVAELQGMVERHRAEIEINLARHNRRWSDVQHYLPDNMVDWAHWLLDHPAALKRKTIRLVKEERAKADAAATREAIFARVERTIERACFEATDPFEQLGHEEQGTAPVELLAAPTGTFKSTVMRRAAVRYVAEHPDESVVIFVPRHKLGDEQIKKLREEHPEENFSAAIWRGRNAPDPGGRDGEKMCPREEAKWVQDALLDVNHSCCKQGRGKKAIKCPLYDGCAWQQQKEVEANIWFMAHEMLTQQPLKVFGNVGLVMIDESPLDAFTFGIDHNDQMLLALDLLHEPPPNGDTLVAQGREALYHALHPLLVPIDRHLGVPPSRQNLHAFINWREARAIHLAEHDAGELHKREWRNKVVPEITPTMTKEQIAEKLEEAAGNGIVKRCATLFELIEQLNEAEDIERCGRIQVQRGKEGREIRLVGLRAVAKGWRSVRTLICDATGDPELLRAVWPDLACEEDGMTKWQQLPRLQNTRIFQIVDRSISKYAVAVEGNEKEIERKAKAAHRMYAALLAKALEYGGAPVAAIVYKSTEEWIRENCFVPQWLTLTHHGDITGTNAFEDVRALFVLGRLLPPAETITRQAEALFGHHIAKRNYRKTVGRIPIVPDAAGNNFIEVETWKHPIANAELLRMQTCEGALIQAVGRARAGLRKADEPLDIHLWTDVPLPALGPVEPVLWDEVETDLDGLMLAAGGVWLENIPHAVEAYKGLFTLDGLKQARISPTLVPGWRPGSGRWSASRSKGGGKPPRRRWVAAGQ